MGMIKKVGDGVKRLCAVLVACVVMWYSVIIAPVFRVGAIDQGSGIAAIGSAFISYILTLATEASVFSPVVGASLGLAMPLLVIEAENSISPGVSRPLQLPKSIPSVSASGQYAPNDDLQNLRDLYIYSFTWDYSTYDTSSGVAADGIIVCEDYSIGMTVIPDEDWVSSSDRQNMTVTLRIPFSWTSSEATITPTVSLSDSSGVRPSARISFVCSFSDGSSFMRSFTWSGTNEYQRFSISIPTSATTHPIFDQSTFEYTFNEALGSDPTTGWHNFHPASNTAYFTDVTIPSSSYPVLTSPITTSEEAINYYDNSIRPYVINNYSDTYQQYTDQFITYEQYYNGLPAAPSETTTPGTGVIIIDPFTLPPDWVQSDVVELETDHYEVPFESMVADPFDYLVSPYTETVTETVRGATKSVPISPPTPQYQVFPKSRNVQETAVGFVNLAYTLLNRSGLDYVIGIAVFGLCVSLLVL